MHMCKHHHYFQSSFITPNSNSVPLNRNCLSPKPLVISTYFLYLRAYLFWVFHIEGVVSYLNFYVWLNSFTQHSVFKVHVHRSTNQPSSSCLSNIPHIYHTLFTHPFDGLLGCFRPWAIMNTAALVYKYLPEAFLSNDLLAHKVILCLAFWGITKLLPMQLGPFVQGSQCFLLFNSILFFLPSPLLQILTSFLKAFFS
jgi:hypothetical protein